MIKTEPTVSVRKQKSKEAAAVLASSHLTNTMKRFLIFIILLSLLIVGEYYFLTEMFTQKRPGVIAGSLGIAILCVYFLVRFYKRSIISSPTTAS
ncbi:MAG: hypothetical protein M3Q06_06485 [Bacteroidota bacterium]|nr:hypothetical protein [Bacteroidota bacterium]